MHEFYSTELDIISQTLLRHAHSDEEGTVAWGNIRMDGMCVMDLSVTLAHKVGPGLQDLQKQGQRILAERNAEKAEENTWIGRMVAAEYLNDMKALIKSRDSA